MNLQLQTDSCADGKKGNKTPYLTYSCTYLVRFCNISILILTPEKSNMHDICIPSPSAKLPAFQLQQSCRSSFRWRSGNKKLFQQICQIFPVANVQLCYFLFLNKQHIYPLHCLVLLHSTNISYNSSPKSLIYMISFDM